MPDPKRAISILIFILVHILLLRNGFLLSKDMLSGDYSAAGLIPSSRYSYARIPDNPATRMVQAQDRLAVDFAQVYFPSRDGTSLGENYRTGILDPLQRPSRYAPLLHVLCSLTICRLDYGPASLLHMLIQVFLFYLVFILSFKALKIERYLLPGLLLANACLFLSPAGLSWFERGQFSLYLATAYLLILLGFIRKNPLLVLSSALFAFIKWTSFPYFFVVFGVVLLSSKTLARGRQNLLLAGAFLLIMITLTFIYPGPGLDFLKGLYSQERFALPGGISLARLLPVTLVKLLPLPLILLGVLHARMNRVAFEHLLPFWAGSAVLMLTYPTLAYEYNLPSLLGFIPLFFYWSNHPEVSLKPPVRNVIRVAFFAFLYFSSFSNSIFNRGGIVLGEYVLISAILLFVPLFYDWKITRPPVP
jgi:hypothetical protein